MDTKDSDKDFTFSIEGKDYTISEKKKWFNTITWNYGLNYTNTDREYYKSVEIDSSFNWEMNADNTLKVHNEQNNGWIHTSSINAPQKIFKYIKQMIKKLKDHSMIITNRFIKKNSMKDWPFFRILITYLRHIAVSLLLSIKYDSSGAFRCIDCKKIPLSDLILAKDNGYRGAIILAGTKTKQGSDFTLIIHTFSRYRGSVEIKNIMSDCCIGVDVIVGFPSELDEDFLKTCSNNHKYVGYLDHGNVKMLSKICKINENYCVMVGPEGDFTEQEIFDALDSGFDCISLSKSRLRTETAGLMACHMLNIINQ